jgi:hypothetical protein
VRGGSENVGKIIIRKRTWYEAMLMPGEGIWDSKNRVMIMILLIPGRAVIGEAEIYARNRLLLAGVCFFNDTIVCLRAQCCMFASEGLNEIPPESRSPVHQPMTNLTLYTT